jgi:hypothetical protein
MARSLREERFKDRPLPGIEPRDRAGAKSGEDSNDDSEDFEE